MNSLSYTVYYTRKLGTWNCFIGVLNYKKKSIEDEKERGGGKGETNKEGLIG